MVAIDTGLSLQAARDTLTARRLPTVNAARATLWMRKLPTFNDALSSLEERAQDLKAAAILREIAPDRLAWLSDPGGLVEVTLDVIHDLAPVDYDMMRADLEAGEDLTVLYPEAHGYDMNFDDWHDLISEPDSVNEDMLLYIFFTLIRFGQDETFLDFAEINGWETHFPRLSDREIDWKKLAKSFEQAGLGYMTHAMDVCWYQTGNIYFDFNPADFDAYPEFPAFTIEGVRELAAAWEAAQPILVDHNRAVEQFQQEPTLAKTIVRCMEKSLKREDRRKRAKTLAEVWAGDEEMRVRVRG